MSGEKKGQRDAMRSTQLAVAGFKDGKGAKECGQFLGAQKEWQRILSNLHKRTQLFFFFFCFVFFF